MGKRARNEDAMEDGNPFAKAGRKKGGQLGGQVQHTVKYCVWELLREQPAGLSVEDLLHEIESRELRSFANSIKPVSQISVELNRAKDYFKQDASTKRWSLRAGSAEARKPFLAEGTTTDTVLVCGPPADQQESGAAADLQSPPAGHLHPGAETAAAQAVATGAAPMALPSEKVGTGPSVNPQLSSAEPSRMAAASHSVDVQQDIRRIPQGQGQGEGTKIEEPAAEPVSTQSASDPMPATFSSNKAPVSVASQPQLPSPQQSEAKQSSAGLQSSTLASGNGVLDMQSGCTDVESAGASAAAPRFIQSPRTGVVRAIHSSPASPIDDMVAQQRPVFGAQLGIGRKYVASPLGPPPQQRTCCHTDGKPALIPDSAGTHAQADAPILEEQLGKPACSVQRCNLQSAAAAPAAGDSKAQPTAQGIAVAIREKEPAREADPLRSSNLEGAALPADQMEEAACAANSHDSAKEDASMPAGVEVRWVPRPEWTNAGEAPGEQPMADGYSALAPLLGSMPWPFPTLYPSTPEREAQPQRPRNALDAPQSIPPNQRDTHSAAPLPPVKSSMQPVFLLEDGEPSLLGAAALPSPAEMTTPSKAAPLLPSASLVPLSTRKSGAGSIATLTNGPTLSVSTCEPAPQLPAAAAETCAPAGYLGQEPVAAWEIGGHSIRGATGNADEAAGLTTGDQTPHDSAHTHPSSAELASEHPHERYQPHHSSGSDRDGRRPSYSDRHRRNDSREQERADDMLGRLGENRYERTRDRDRQESVRDYDARRERQQDHASEYGSRTESADGERRREQKQGPLRSTSRERDRPAGRAHEDAWLARKRDDRGDYNDRYRDSRARDGSNAERHVESGHRSREGSRPDDRIKDPPRSPWHDGLRKQKPREVEQESSHGVNRRGPGQPRSRSGTREFAPRDDSCPFEAGRVIGCSEAAEAAALKRMTFGSDLRKDLEGIDGRIAVFLWNYDRGRLHGIFSGSSKDIVTEPTGRDDPYLYEIRVHNFATYRSLPLEVVRRIIPTNGRTHKGRQLLKTCIDRGTVVKLCREFEKKR